MTGETPSVVTAVVGVTALRLAATDAHLNYVKPSLRPWLIVSGVLLLALGARGLRDALRGRRTSDTAPGVAWLLVLPVLTVFLVAPQPLGAFAVGRNPARFEAPRASFPKLPAPVDGAVSMTLTEFTLRSLFDTDRALDGKLVRLTGFVSREKTGEVHLTRFVLSCCAADARSVRVQLSDRPDLPAPDTWIEVVGRWQPVVDLGSDEAGGARPVRIAVERLRRIPRPEQPYE